MRSRASSRLAFLLLIASAAPPPAMAVRLLLALAPAGQVESRQALQIRGRNRLASFPGVEVRLFEAGRGSGGDRLARSSRPAALDPAFRVSRSIPPIVPSATLPVLSATKLRC